MTLQGDEDRLGGCYAPGTGKAVRERYLSRGKGFGESVFGRNFVGILSERISMREFSMTRKGLQMCLTGRQQAESPLALCTPLQEK